MKHLLIYVIEWIVLGIILTTFYSLVKASRKKDLATNSSNCLSLPFYLLLIGIVSFLFFTLFLVRSLFFPNGTESVFSTVVFSFFSLLGLILIYTYFIHKMSFTTTEILYRRFTGKKVTISFSSINCVSYQANMQWIVLEYGNSKKSYFPIVLKGIRPFSTMILQNINSDKIDSVAQDVLKQLKDGELV